MSSGIGEWYVRARGRVLGPFNRSQLVSLRDRGHLLEDHEVSQDRRSWIKAAELPWIYGKIEDAKPPQSTAQNLEWPVSAVADQPGPGRVADTAPSWFIALGDQPSGPLDVVTLHRMMSDGEIGPDSLVWKDGMPNWVPLRQVPELQFVAGTAARVSQHAGAPTDPAQAAGALTSAPHPLPRTSALAVASLVLGLIWVCGIGSLLATIFGAVSLSQITRSNGAVSGKGLALAGLILGILGIVLSIALVCAFWLFGSELGQGTR